MYEYTRQSAMTEQLYNADDLENMSEQQQQLLDELSFLFGRQTVEQACMLDVVDLNLNETMTASIISGLTKLKQLRGNPESQQELINSMEAGGRLLLCLWIMEMGLLDKVRSRPYLQN